MPALVPGTSCEAVRDDPRADGWDTESLHEETSALVKGIATYLAAPDAARRSALDGLASASLECAARSEVEAGPAFRDAAFSVRRLQVSAPGSLRGAAGLAAALESFRSPYPPGAVLDVKLKQYRVELGVDRERFSTSVYAHWSGATPTGVRECNATWHLVWRRGPEGAHRLESLSTERQEEAEAPRRLFRDSTEAVLAREAVFDAQLRPGIDHWLARLELSTGVDVGGWQGLAIGDADGDGLEDIYLCQPGGLPNRLFLQNGDGSARDASAAAGVDWIDSTHAALFVDLDQDGDPDLVVAVDEGVLVQSNDGRGVFKVERALPLPAGIPYSMAAADYDQDGDLDLYVACYNPRRGVNRHLVFARPVPYHDAQNGAPNVLLRNDGAFRFTHATKRVGLDEENRRFSYAAAWEDYDNDGDLDLFVANDFGRKNLYRNDGGRFHDVARAANAEDMGPGMSASWGDYDNDGLMDLYASNMFSSAGNRIAAQPRFLRSAESATRSGFQRHARGNTLLRNRGDGRFDDVSETAGVTIGRWAWGSLFVDINNDGWQDLFVANGFITQADPGDL